ELQYHRTLAMHKHRHGNGYAWRLDDGSGPRQFPITPVLVANDPAELQGALQRGEGRLVGADVMVKQAVEWGKVKRVLAGWVGPEYEFNAVFPRGHGQAPKVRAFIDFLLERLTVEIDYMSQHCANLLAAWRGVCGQAADAVAKAGGDGED